MQRIDISIGRSGNKRCPVKISTDTRYLLRPISDDPRINTIPINSMYMFSNVFVQHLCTQIPFILLVVQ